MAVRVVGLWVVEVEAATVALALVAAMGVAMEARALLVVRVCMVALVANRGLSVAQQCNIARCATHKVLHVRRPLVASTKCMSPRPNCRCTNDADRRRFDAW